MPAQLSTIRDIPTYSWTDWDRIESVKAAIKNLERGQLDAPAQVVDAMRRDDRLRGNMLKRSEAVPALPRVIEPAKGRKSGAAVKDLTESWDSMFPAAVLAELEMWAIMLGVSFGELVWTMVGGKLTVKLKVWHPRFFYWRWDTRSWWVATMDGALEVKPGDGKWVIHTPYGFDRAWMGGIARCLYVPWLIRQWTMRDWARWSEVHGMPIRLARTPAAADAADKERFLRELASLGAESVVRLPTSPDKEQQFDIELVEATSTGFEGFERLLNKAESAMDIAVLGQNLTTEVKGGSYAAATVHKEIAQTIVQNDATYLAMCLREQALRPWAEYNYGSADLAPMVSWKTDPPEDKVQKGVALKNMGDGIVALQATGAKPDVDKLLEDGAIPTKGPAGDPPKPEPVEKLPQPIGKKPTLREAASALLGNVKQAGGVVQGQLYVDKLGTKAVERGAGALAGDVSKLLAAVAAAVDFDDLKARLLDAYGQMDEDKFATLMQRALVMAELAGQVAVLEDT